MTTNASPPRTAEVQRAWAQLREKGTANREIANRLRVGLDGVIDRFEELYLGDHPHGPGECCKLILGANGEGKTHFLLCIKERALHAGHLVALVEARSVGAAASPFLFGQQILLSLETPPAGGVNEVHPLVTLLRAAVDQKRTALISQNLETDELLLEWAEEMRLCNLQPSDIAEALSDGLKAVMRDDNEATLSSVKKLSLEGRVPPQQQQQILGANLLRSIVRLPRILGFRPLVLLIDEAEGAVAKAGSARRQAFLQFLRFLNDHFALSDQGGAVVLIACTDDFWPGEFDHYTALKGRLSDPGRDSPTERRDASLRSLLRTNKLWVRETFRGAHADYSTLGEAILSLGSQVFPDLDLELQRRNADRLAKVASSQAVIAFIKRPFVKALAMTVDEQADNGQQEELSDSDAQHRFNVAVDQVQTMDDDE